MNKITIHINCDNAAFEDGLFTEAARIIRKAADYVDTRHGWEGFTVPLRDLNGNKCGYIEASHGDRGYADNEE